MVYLYVQLVKGRLKVKNIDFWQLMDVVIMMCFINYLVTHYVYYDEEHEADTSIVIDEEEPVPLMGDGYTINLDVDIDKKTKALHT